MSRATQRSLIVLGLAVAVFGGAILWRATAVTPVDKTLVRVSAGLIAVGLILAAPQALASGVRKVGAAVGPYLPWTKGMGNKGGAQ